MQQRYRDEEEPFDQSRIFQRLMDYHECNHKAYLKAFLGKEFNIVNHLCLLKFHQLLPKQLFGKSKSDSTQQVNQHLVCFIILSPWHSNSTCCKTAHLILSYL